MEKKIVNTPTQETPLTPEEIAKRKKYRAKQIDWFFGVEFKEIRKVFTGTVSPDAVDTISIAIAQKKRHPLD